jgi:phage terminase large subunit-like protein
LPKRSPPPTRRGLLPEARHLVLPKGIVSSGFPRVQATCGTLGIEFDPWQSDLNRCLLAKGKDGLYAADTAVISISRQVGKTFDIGAVVFAECIAEPGTTVIWTAHRFKVARETFNELRGLAKSPQLAAHIDYDTITTAAGNECIPFRNGSRIVFAARERGAIRGFTKVRILVLDEGQILTHSVLADLAPTMNQAVNPLIIIMGTPPKPTDNSEVFTELRKDALAQFQKRGHSEGVLFVEFSADHGASPDDLKQLRKANPSYPTRTPLRAIKRLRRLLSVDDFLREVFGIWDESDVSDPILQAILSRWGGLAGKATVPDECAYAVDVSPDRMHSAINAAGVVDGRRLMFVVESDVGVGWVIPKLVELRESKGLRKVSVDSANGSPAASLIPKIEAAGIEVEPVTAGGMARACGELLDEVQSGELVHLDDPLLNAALAAAVTRTIGDGGWGWQRKGSANITPLVAGTLALAASHDMQSAFFAAWR